MVGQCAGFRSFQSKSGVNWFIYCFLIPFSDSERRQGLCDGLNVVQYWVDHSLNCVSGKAYELYFEPDNYGKARLAHVVEREGGDK